VLSQVDASSDFRLVEPYETSKNDRMTGEIVGQRTTGLEISPAQSGGDHNDGSRRCPESFLSLFALFSQTLFWSARSLILCGLTGASTAGE
jgi:hypothetical protein